MNGLEDRWELPWPRLDVPVYRDARVGEWSLESVMLLAPKGYFQTAPVGGVRLRTLLVRHGVDGPVTVMSTLPMEIESNAKHVAAASGTVVVMGAGLGLSVHNILKNPRVERVIVVERDPDIVDLLGQAVDLKSWEGFEKLSFAIDDALVFVPEEEVDFLYADIWDELGAACALADTQAMQRNVRAKRVGWWGQELHFIRWLVEQGHSHAATAPLYERWVDSVGLPLSCEGDASYVALIEAVALNYPDKVGMEFPPPIPVPDLAVSDPDEEGLVDHTMAPDGTRLTLCCRNNEFGIQVDGLELMSTEARSSEEALARLSCRHLADRPGAQILIGGLGIGFTLRAALDSLPADARVIVIEVVEAVVDWNRRYLRDHNGDPLSDPRVTVVVSDIVRWLRESTEMFDAILLDVDNGPEQLAFASNESLYTSDGLKMLEARLKPTGVLAVWSGTRARRFEARLREAGMRTETHEIDAVVPGVAGHAVYVASRP